MPTIGSLTRAIANKRLTLKNERAKQRKIARLQLELSALTAEVDRAKQATARARVNAPAPEEDYGSDDYWNK